MYQPAGCFASLRSSKVTRRSRRQLCSARRGQSARRGTGSKPAPTLVGDGSCCSQDSALFQSVSSKAVLFSGPATARTAAPVMRSSIAAVLLGLLCLALPASGAHQEGLQRRRLRVLFGLGLPYSHQLPFVRIGQQLERVGHRVKVRFVEALRRERARLRSFWATQAARILLPVKSRTTSLAAPSSQLTRLCAQYMSGLDPISRASFQKSNITRGNSITYTVKASEHDANAIGVGLPALAELLCNCPTNILNESDLCI